MNPRRYLVLIVVLYIANAIVTVWGVMAYQQSLSQVAQYQTLRQQVLDLKVTAAESQSLQRSSAYATAHGLVPTTHSIFLGSSPTPLP